MKLYKVNRIVLFTVLILTNTFILYSQDESFTASVEPESVVANEQFQVTFTFSASSINDVRNFKAPDFSQFVVISGPNQSTSIQWINGKSSASISYTYILYARQTGKYRINSASIEYKGKTYTSPQVQIEVTPNSPKQQRKQEQPSPTVNVENNIFIKAYTDKSNVKQGEQLTVTFKLYTRLGISNYELSKAPTYEGFWSEDFDMPKTPVVNTETIEGKQYKVVTIKKTALFATQSGNLKIAPLELRCAVQVQSKRRSNDWFDSFFNDPFFQQYQSVNVEIKSNPITIKVEPLPSNAPADFTGAVGRFTFNSTIDKRDVKSGDPITLRMTVSGIGNIRLVKLPKLKLPNDIESYEPKISEEISREGGVIKGKKIAEYLLVPRNSGQRIIEPMSFVYFDLDKREYITLKSPRFELSIERGKEYASGVSVTSKEDIRILGEDIRFIKLSIGQLRHRDEVRSMLWLFLGFFIPPLMFVTAWFYRKRMEKIYGNMPRLLFETAGREASRRLKRARALLEEGKAENYHAEILKALTEYIEHKLGIPKANFVLEQAINILRTKGINEHIIQSLKTCIERAEFIRYAPASDTTSIRKELLEMATNVINQIEQHFGKKGKK